MRVALYLRVSTDDQDVENQRRVLRQVAEINGWDVVAEHIDAGLSGSLPRDQRPGMVQALAAIGRGEVEMLAAWALDRLGRDLQDLLGLVGELRDRGCGLYLHLQRLDTSTPAGVLMLQVLGAVAEFERNLIRERTKAGVARARAAGRRLGRPSRATVERIARLAGEGVADGEIALATGRNVETVRAIRERRARCLTA